MYDRVCEMLAERGNRMIAGDPLDPATQLGPLASRSQLQNVLSYFAIAQDEGLTCIAGGKRLERQGYFVAPTVYRDVSPESRIAREEIFGPVAAMIRFEDEDDAVRLANDTRYGLAAGIWTEDLRRAHRMLHRIRAGTIWVNNYRVIGHTLPFGGYGQSGIGREMGAAALEAYTEVKSVWIDMGNKVEFRTGPAEDKLMTYDLVVIGCGAGGLSAAVAYADRVGRDAHIAVLERATREGRGGATRWTSSWWRITADRHLDPAFIETMARISGGKADLEYCRAFASEVPATFDFLDRHAVPWIYFDQPFANRNTGGGLGMPVPGGVAIVDTLTKVIDDLPNAVIHYETEAIALSTDAAGRVTGVHVRGPEGTKHLAARAVVIACGGFEGAPGFASRASGPARRSDAVDRPHARE